MYIQYMVPGFKLTTFGGRYLVKMTLPPNLLLLCLKYSLGVVIVINSLCALSLDSQHHTAIYWSKSTL